MYVFSPMEWRYTSRIAFFSCNSAWCHSSYDDIWFTLSLWLYYLWRYLGNMFCFDWSGPKVEKSNNNILTKFGGKTTHVLLLSYTQTVVDKPVNHICKLSHKPYCTHAHAHERERWTRKLIRTRTLVSACRWTGLQLAVERGIGGEGPQAHSHSAPSINHRKRGTSSFLQQTTDTTV